jgi:hypothetical protein
MADSLDAKMAAQQKELLDKLREMGIDPEALTKAPDFNG